MKALGSRLHVILIVVWGGVVAVQSVGFAEEYTCDFGDPMFVERPTSDLEGLARARMRHRRKVAALKQCKLRKLAPQKKKTASVVEAKHAGKQNPAKRER